MALTDEQRKAVEEKGRVIVSASAGSGKTTVMIRRIVDLVCGEEGKEPPKFDGSGAKVGEVLAVTFTNKAAAQMREKLRNALSEKIVACEDEARKAALMRELSALPLAEISTIHAFCGRLIRTYFYYADEEIQPDFRILTPEESESLSLRAMNEVFDRAYAERDADFHFLLSAYFKRSDSALRELVKDLYKKVRGFADYRDRLLAAGNDTFDASAKYLADDFKKQCGEYRIRLEKFRDYFERNFGKAVELCDVLLDAAEAILASDGLFEMKEISYSPPNNITSRGVKDEDVKRNWNKLKKIKKKIETIFQTLSDIGSEEEERRRLREAGKRAAAIGKLVLEYDAAFAACKREAGALDYDDLEHFAYELLCKEEVEKEVKKRFRYVFVDEYQDVNPMQEALIMRLAGDELFLVGDDKQAIYAFRGSKSKFFIRTAKEYAKKKKALSLTKNFRSAKPILDAVNLVFPNIILGYVPMNGGERFQIAEGEKNVYSVLAPKKDGEKKKRGVYSVLQDEEEDGDDSLSETIVEIVKSELGRDRFDPDADDGKGAVKKIGYGDIAVLVRNNSGDGERIVRALSDVGIPVTSTADVNVTAYFEARLLIDWLSFLDNAEQDIPFAGAMLSGIGKFTNEELVRIRLASEGKMPFRTAVKRYPKAAACDGELKKKIDAFFETAARLRAISRVRTAAETMNLLLSEGLEVQIALKPDGRNRLARVRRLVSEGDGVSVHAFLRKLKEREDGKVQYGASGGDNAVNVMTMHSSKGLEFPVVILASISTNVTKTDSSAVLFADDISQGEGKEISLIAPKYFDESTKTVYETLARLAAKTYNLREEQDGERNLLYVGMTRAQYRLWLVYQEKSDALDRKSIRYSDFTEDDFPPADLIPPAPARKTDEAEEGESYCAEALRQAFRASEEYGKRYGDGARLPMKSSATAIMRAADHGAFVPPIGEEGLEPSSADDGLAYHAFLEHVRFGASAREELARMKNEGVLPEKYLALLDAEKLEKILALSCFRAVADKPKWREQKFLLSLPASAIASYGTNCGDEVVFQGAIDLLYLDENGYVIVDYKFSALDGDALKIKYAPQIDLYRKAVAKAKRVDENKIRARIVNIRRLEEIPM